METLLAIFLTAGISFIIAYIFHLKSLKVQKTPSFCYENFTLDTEKIRGLVLTYNNENFKRITRTLIAFWNGGTRKIEKEDLIGTHLKINFSEDVSVLKAQVLHSNMLGCNFAAKELLKDNRYTNFAGLTFDFVGPNHGAVIEILHTGYLDEGPGFGEDSFKELKVKSKGRFISLRQRKSIDVPSKIYMYLGIAASIAFLVGISALIFKFIERNIAFDIIKFAGICSSVFFAVSIPVRMSLPKIPDSLYIPEVEESLPRRPFFRL